MNDKNKPMKYKDLYSSTDMAEIKEPLPLPLRIFKNIFLFILKVGITFFLIGVITGSIVVTALTVYVMQTLDSQGDVEIVLPEIQNSFTTNIYAYADGNETGEPTKIATLSRGLKREWVDLSSLPQYVQAAVVFTEDRRFYDHTGVDFKRTFAAFANVFLNFWDTRAGGSTITQQTIKMITGDTETQGIEGFERKIKEIFRSLKFEEYYTKQEILEAYVNLIPMGGERYGIGVCARYFFGKSAKELTVAEAAALAAMINSPSVNNPMTNEKGNKERRDKYVLPTLLEFECITQDQYEEALNVTFTDLKPYGGVEEETTEENMDNWFTDHVIRSVILDLMEQQGYSYEEADEKLYTGGYNVYTTMDMELQEYLEGKYNDVTNFVLPGASTDDVPQSAFVVMDYDGRQLAVVGARGEKEEYRAFNIATQGERPIGSTIKPITTYALSLQNNSIWWSKILADQPITIKQNGKDVQWPTNYGNLKYGSVYIYYALANSLNTIPAQLGQALTPKVMYNFMTEPEKLNFTTLVPADADYSPLCTGSFTNGLHLSELVASYQMFGNGGKMTNPYCYTKVTDSEGNIILQPFKNTRRIIDEDTAWIMNRMLYNVVNLPGSSGVRSKLDNNIELCAKTGTSQEWYDLTYVGLTPYHVSGIWFGYRDEQRTIPPQQYNITWIWKNIMNDWYSQMPAKNFEVSPSADYLYYCKSTGLLASGTCSNTAAGWFKKNSGDFVGYCGH